MLRQNCFDLADSFCLYSVDKTALNNAAGYFLLSGRPISDVVQHIKNKYSDVSINEGREREYMSVCVCVVCVKHFSPFKVTNYNSF